MTKRLYRDIAPFGLRLPPDLKDKLQAEGEGKVKWSLNSEIISRLEASYAQQPLANYTDGELIDELIRRYGRDGVFIQLGAKSD